MTDALTFLKTRRSRPAKTLTEPVPDKNALKELLTIAARSPDHGKLEPWRFIVLERVALLRLATLARSIAERLDQTLWMQIKPAANMRTVRLQL